MAPIEALVSLRVLLLAGNRLDDLLGLAGMRSLELIDLRHNYIGKLHAVRLLSFNTELRSLQLVGNPVAKLPSFRAAVIAQLPTLQMLDGVRTPRSPVRPCRCVWEGGRRQQRCAGVYE